MQIYSWGRTSNGELGLGGIEDTIILKPRLMKASLKLNVKKICCGEHHSLLITKSGELYSFGKNDFGQLGQNKARSRPEKISSLESYDIIDAVCGVEHSIAIDKWGQLFSWGSNSCGQLGLNLSCKESVSIPKLVNLKNKAAIQINSGENHCLLLTNNNEIFSWGANNFGQLGVNTTSSFISEPIKVNSLEGIPISQIACGGNHNVVLSKSGAVFCWGRNTFGQLGLNDQENRLYPCLLRMLRNHKVIYVSCGTEHTACLTMDGGVFTFGAGMYGQLGHNSFSNEIVPRQVLELMGSHVAQLSCGSYHTLAYVPMTDKLYAFGLNSSGQLGIGTNENICSPIVISNFWKTNALQCNTDVFTYRIYGIFSGGHQSFIIIHPLEDEVKGLNFSHLDPKQQILYLTASKLSVLSAANSEKTVSEDLLQCLEIVFSSSGCLNSSFLLPNNAHYNCSSQNSGVDYKAVAEGFNYLSQCKNNTIIDLITCCISEHLLPNLPSNPPDVEALRLYLLLPWYHPFGQPTNYPVLQKLFAVSVISLAEEAQRIIDRWWSAQNADFFLRLITCYKRVIVHLLALSASKSSKDLELCLKLLTKLNHINQEDHLKVPYETFYIPEITEWINIRLEYYNWLTQKQHGQFYFLDYPFVFDAQAKTLLLQTDGSLQMQNAMEEAAQQIWINLIMTQSFDPSHQFLVLVVRRNYIVQDTLEQLSQQPHSDLKKPLKIIFKDEEAMDAGGVKKEFFLLLIREILDPKYGMFKIYEESNCIWFNENSFEEEVMYYLIGVLCGLAIYNSTIIALPFPLALYKKLLGQPTTLQDFEELSPIVARSLKQLLLYDGDDFSELFHLHFEITREVYGEVFTYPLKEDGSNISVTQSNKGEYVELYVDWILRNSITRQYDAFHSGFHKVCSSNILRLFQPKELMAMVVGNENYDWEQLQKYAEYKNGYHENHPTIKIFWEVFHSLNTEQKKKFLLFLTGSDRIPILGMKAVKIVIQMVRGGVEYLPVAHTCFNILDLPQYQNHYTMHQKLLQSIENCEGFHLV